MDVTRGMDAIGEMVYRSLTEELRLITELLEAALDGKDPECIHQMRVNVRRIRVSLRSFRQILPEELVQLDSELRWVARSLGQVRDADIQSKSIPELALWIGEIRGRRLNQLRSDLRSERYLNLVAKLKEEIDAERSPNKALALTPCLVAFPDVAERAFHLVKRRASKVERRGTGEDFHWFRKGAKRLRYTIDPFINLYDKNGQDFVKELKELQDVLGKVQDAVVSLSFCDELRGVGPAKLLHESEKAAHHRLKELHPKALDLFFRLSKEWRHFSKVMDGHRAALWMA